MLKKYLCTTGILASLLFLPACLKEDLSKITDNYIWKPSISLPLKSLVFTADDFLMPPSEIDTSNAPYLTKSINFEFADIYTDSEYVDSLMLRMEIKNNFPALIKVTAFYMNESGSIIKTIVGKPPLTLQKPLVDKDGNIIRVETLLYEHNLKKEDVPTLQETKTILFRALIKNLEQSKEVLSKSDEWRIDIAIGLRSSMNLPIDEI